MISLNIVGQKWEAERMHSGQSIGKTTEKGGAKVMMVRKR